MRKGGGESDRDRAASSAVKTHHGVAGCRRGGQERPDIDGLSVETGNCFRANVCVSVMDMGFKCVIYRRK